MQVSTNLPHVKLQNRVCAHTIACNFGVHTHTSEYMQHKKDPRHELMLDLLHYMCDVQVQ